MTRLLGIKIEHPKKRFTELIEVGSATSGRSRLTTLSPQQDVAEIEIFLLRRTQDASQPLSEIRRLHRFIRPHTNRTNETRPLFELSALRRGRRKYEVQLYEDGKRRETVTVRVPRSPGAVAALSLLLLALVGVGIGARALLDPAESTRPERSEIEAVRDTDEETETGRTETERSRASGDDARNDSGPRAEAESDETKTGTETITATSDPVTDPASQEPPVEVVEPVVRTETIYFLPNSIQLTRDAARTLDTFLSRIQSDEIVEIRVEGHTALYGNEAGRELISRGRIDAVLSYLERSGWRPETLPETKTFGAQAPVTRATDQQHLNRRAEIHITARRHGR